MSRDTGTRVTKSHRHELGRRAFLGGAAAVGLGAGAVGAAGATSEETFPHVSTRGHFDIAWYGSVYRTDGHTQLDYETEGSIPGVDEPAGDELLVHAHGWQNDPDDALESFDAIRRALRGNDYDAPVVGFSWDSDTLYTRWWKATEIAERNGPKLANFLYQYAQANPDVTVRLVCHSLGARVALRAVEVLNENDLTDVVESLTLLGGAANDESVSANGQYGPDIEAATGQTDNFWMDDDAVLDWAYSTAEWDGAVGEEGCEGTQPENYEDHDVGYVPSHGDYFRPGDGCIPAVVDEF